MSDVFRSVGGNNSGSRGLRQRLCFDVLLFAGEKRFWVRFYLSSDIRSI